MLLLIDFFIFLLPTPFLMWLGRRLGTLFYVLDRKHRKIALGNLQHAFPEYTSSLRRRIARQAFQHLILLGIETLILSRKSFRFLRDRVLDSGFENLEKARTKKQSILFLTGHSGNWELLAKLGRGAGFIESVVARDVKSKRVQHWIEDIRNRYGVRVIGKGQIRHIVEEFREKRTVGALIDQDGGTRGTFANFFGRPASTPTGIIRLGIKIGVPILPVFLRRVSDRLEFRCFIGPDLAEGLEDLSLEEKEKRVLQRFTRSLEEFIREDPAQWLWLHRRWKTRPEGEVNHFAKKVLVLSDGKPGHVNQMLGVTRRMEGWESQICPVHFRSFFHRCLIYGMAFLGIPWMRVLWGSLRTQTVEQLPAWTPSLILACGSIGASVAFFLKTYYGAKAVVLMRSGFPHVEKLFDLVCLPLHDGAKPHPRIVSLVGMPTVITKDFIECAVHELVQKLSLGEGRRIGVLVGGHSRRLRMKTSQMRKLGGILTRISNSKNCELLVATSRRTPKPVEEALKNAMDSKVFSHLLLARHYPENPIPGILGLADIIVVTEDSFSMMMEAVHSGKSVVTVRMPCRGLRRAKYEKTLEALEKEGRLRRVAVKELEKVLEFFLKEDDRPRQMNNIETERVVEAIQHVISTSGSEEKSCFLSSRTKP